MNRAEPSPIAHCAPPECRLPKPPTNAGLPGIVLVAELGAAGPAGDCAAASGSGGSLSFCAAIKGCEILVDVWIDESSTASDSSNVGIFVISGGGSPPLLGRGSPLE